MRRLVQDMMVLREKPPVQAQIDQLFQAMWPRLESRVNEAKRQSPDLQNVQRTTQEMLEELVERVRRIDRVHSREVPGFVSSGFGARTSDDGERRSSDIDAYKLSWALRTLHSMAQDQGLNET